MKKLCTLIASFLIAHASFGQSTEEHLASFNTKTDVVYKTIDGKKLTLILFLPDKPSEEKMPVMIYTHGGGWAGGNPYSIFKPSFKGTLRGMLDKGIACAAIQYRLTKNGITAADSVQDCKDAARFIMENAESLKLDPQRMGVFGGSAGGHLSLMTGLSKNELFLGDQKLSQHDPQFKCIVSYYPLTSFLRSDLLKESNFETPAKLAKIIGESPSKNPKIASLLSPSTHLKKDSPPVLLIHGKKDKVIPISQSELLMEVGQKEDSNIRLISVKGAGHSFKGKKISPSIEAINQSALDFITSHLKPATR